MKKKPEECSIKELETFLEYHHQNIPHGLVKNEAYRQNLISMATRILHQLGRSTITIKNKVSSFITKLGGRYWNRNNSDLMDFNSDMSSIPPQHHGHVENTYYNNPFVSNNPFVDYNTPPTHDNYLSQRENNSDHFSSVSNEKNKNTDIFKSVNFDTPEHGRMGPPSKRRRDSGDNSMIKPTHKSTPFRVDEHMDISHNAPIKNNAQTAPIHPNIQNTPGHAFRNNQNSTVVVDRP